MQAQRLVWLDALRLIAGVSMVGLHASADAAGQPFPDASFEERLPPLLFRAVIYTARTELFLIISVFLLLMALERRPRGYGQTIREQARRLLVPFAFWAVFYAFYNLIKAQSFGYEAAIWDQLGSLQAWLGYLILGDVKYHMHFLPTLFGLVLIYPLFRLAVAHPWLGLVVIVCLLIKREADLFLWSNLQNMPGFDYVLRLIKVLSYAGYGMLAGAFLGIWRRMPPPDAARQWLGLLGYLALMLFAIKLIYTWRVAQHATWQWNFTPAYWADFLFPALLFALALMASHMRWPAVISKMAPYSFGIYLCHPIFLDLIETTTRGWQVAPWALVATKASGALVATTLLVLALERFRPLSWTVGLGPLPLIEGRRPRPTPISQ